MLTGVMPSTHSIHSFLPRIVSGRQRKTGPGTRHGGNADFGRPWFPAAAIRRGPFADAHGKSEADAAVGLLLRPPPFPGSSFTSWDRRGDALDAAYRWGQRAIEGLVRNGDPAFAMTMSLSRP